MDRLTEHLEREASASDKKHQDAASFFMGLKKTSAAKAPKVPKPPKPKGLKKPDAPAPVTSGTRLVAKPRALTNKKPDIPVKKIKEEPTKVASLRREAIIALAANNFEKNAWRPFTAMGQAMKSLGNKSSKFVEEKARTAQLMADGSRFANEPGFAARNWNSLKGAVGAGMKKLKPKWMKDMRPFEAWRRLGESPGMKAKRKSLRQEHFGDLEKQYGFAGRKGYQEKLTGLKATDAKKAEELEKAYAGQKAKYDKDIGDVQAGMKLEDVTGARQTVGDLIGRFKAPDGSVTASSVWDGVKNLGADPEKLWEFGTGAAATIAARNAAANAAREERNRKLLMYGAGGLGALYVGKKMLEKPSAPANQPVPPPGQSGWSG